MIMINRAMILKLVLSCVLISTIAVIGVFLDTAPAGAWCPDMGGYSSYEAQAAAQRSRTAEESAKAKRNIVEKSNIISEQVKADQQSMKDLGYYKGEINGIDNPVFQTAVSSFRKANGLANGTTLDVKIRETIKAGQAITKDQSLQGIADQKSLKTLGYYQGEVDGIPSPRFENAVSYFRSAHGLGEGATLDMSSREILNSNKALPLFKADQLSLKKLGYYKGEVNGKPGITFQTAINEFAQVNGLGDITTLDEAGHNILYGGTAITKEQSRQLQADLKALKSLGYYQGEYDDIFANRTVRSAITIFRKANGLEDGTKLDTSSREILYNGKAVTQLLADQQALKNLGYFPDEMNAQSRSTSMQAAITNFRAVNGLGSASTLDTTSREILYGGKAISSEQRQQIIADQKTLIELGYFHGEADGIPGSGLFQAAVSDFRMMNGLGHITTLDSLSRKILHGGKAITKEDSLQRMIDRVALRALGYFQGDIYDISEADLQNAIVYFRDANKLTKGPTLDATSREALLSGKAISQFMADQRALIELGYEISNTQGIMDFASMQTAVNNFRRANGLESGSMLDPQSRALISGGKVITQYVADQRELKKLGFYKGDTNGKRSPDFMEAVSDFRAANGLMRDTTLNVPSREILYGGNAVTKDEWEARPRWWQIGKPQEARETTRPADALR